MKLKISLLTKILNEDRITFYLLHKEKRFGINMILPIEVPSVIKTSAEDTYIRTLKALNAKITSITIYLFLESVYYVYLRVVDNSKAFDINTTIENALNIIYYQPNIEIFIEENILKQEGIQITKEMISKYENLTGDILNTQILNN